MANLKTFLTITPNELNNLAMRLERLTRIIYSEVPIPPHMKIPAASEPVQDKTVYALLESAEQRTCAAFTDCNAYLTMVEDFFDDETKAIPGGHH